MVLWLKRIGRVYRGCGFKAVRIRVWGLKPCKIRASKWDNNTLHLHHFTPQNYPYYCNILPPKITSFTPTRTLALNYHPLPPKWCKCLEGITYNLTLFGVKIRHGLSEQERKRCDWSRSGQTILSWSVLKKDWVKEMIFNKIIYKHRMGLFRTRCFEEAYSRNTCKFV